MEAAVILKIQTPEALFSEPDNVKKEFIEFAKIWHPDHCLDKSSHEVFEHLNKLHELAKQKIANHVWETPNELKFKDKHDKNYTIRYKRKHVFDLGSMYVGETIVAFMLNSENKDLFNNAISLMQFKYASNNMQTEMAKYLPNIQKTLITSEDKYCLVMAKTPDLILLRDIFDHYKQDLDNRHVAWIMSRLYNICCYLNYAGINHNDISMDTLFISPLHHSVALFGGWWYSTNFNRRLLALPKRTYNLMPVSDRVNKMASRALDLDLVRALGRELLNENNCVKLKYSKKTPDPLLNWLCGASKGNALTEYGTWTNDILIKSFGTRKFVKMEIDSSIIYP